MFIDVCSCLKHLRFPTKACFPTRAANKLFFKAILFLHKNFQMSLPTFTNRRVSKNIKRINIIKI